MIPGAFAVFERHLKARLCLFRQTFPVIWTVIAVTEPRLKIPEIKVGPCCQISCHVNWESMCQMCALESVHPMNHQEPNVQRQPSEDLTPERQWSNQTRERTLEEPPKRRPRTGNPASSIRWSRVDDPGHWVPATTVEGEEDRWTETDPEVLWQQQVDDHIWKNTRQPACLCQEEWDELFINTCENIRHICVSVELNSLA